MTWDGQINYQRTIKPNTMIKCTNDISSIWRIAIRVNTHITAKPYINWQFKTKKNISKNSGPMYGMHIVLWIHKQMEWRTTGNDWWWNKKWIWKTQWKVIYHDKWKNPIMELKIKDPEHSMVL